MLSDLVPSDPECKPFVSAEAVARVTTYLQRPLGNASRERQVALAGNGLLVR